MEAVFVDDVAHKAVVFTAGQFDFEPGGLFRRSHSHIPPKISQTRRMQGKTSPYPPPGKPNSALLFIRQNDSIVPLPHANPEHVHLGAISDFGSIAPMELPR
jgi:hypothetical protein